MKVVDPHIHLWDPATLSYPWLNEAGESYVGDVSPLRKTYVIDDLLSDASDIEVVKVVHIEAKHDPSDPVAETRWLQSMADEKGMPNGIVAAVDFSAPDVESTLAAHVEFRNVRGIRQILNVHPNPLFDYVGRHYMHEEIWRKNFGLLAKYGLSFDLQIYPSQMKTAARLASTHSDIQLILNHAGMFVDRHSVEGWRAWRDGMRELATCPNIAVKICGFAMFDHHWTVESLRPYVLETIDTFGVERCMFASNFPVDGLYGSYSATWAAFADIVSDLSEQEKQALFLSNAERYYRI